MKHPIFINDDQLTIRHNGIQMPAIKSEVLQFLQHFISNSKVVQGSTLGSFSYRLCSLRFETEECGFYMFKFADDMSLVTTVDYYGVVPNELEHIDTWAFENNMILNKNKTKEITFRNIGVLTILCCRSRGFSACNL